MAWMVRNHFGNGVQSFAGGGRAEDEQLALSRTLDSFEERQSVSSIIPTGESLTMNTVQVRRTLKNVALFAVLGCAVVGLSQCRLVEDKVTGVDLSSRQTANAHSDCIKDCEEVYKAADRAEDQRYQAAKRACGHDKECDKREKKIHEDRKDDIKDALKECKRGCYNEGSGGGGR